MRNEIVALAQQQAKVAVRRAAVPVALTLTAATLFVVGVAALFFALLYGPTGAALIVAAVAIVLGLITIALLSFRPRPQPAPASNTTLPQVVSFVAQSASSLGPRQTALAAFLLAIVLGLLARGSSGAKK
jgi:hypothetical protein